MRSHDCAHAGIYRSAKWNELDTIQPRACGGDRRQSEVGVPVGVAVTGKVLSRCDHAVLLQPTDERGAEHGCQSRILAEGADANHRVCGIVVDVQNRRERDVNPERASFRRRDASLIVGERAIARRSDPHLGGEDRRAAQVDSIGEEVATAGAVAGAELEIRANEQRQCAEPLHRVQLLRDLDR